MRFALATLAAIASAQQVGHYSQEYHLPLKWYHDNQEQSGAVVLDANWRWTHINDGYTNCYEGTNWDQSFCPDDVTCAKNCALEGVDLSGYNGIYGVQTSSDVLKLGFKTGGNVGSRNYLMSGEEYQLFQLVGKEFSFDVDVSSLPCGVNGALYFSQMKADGGLSQYSGNNAGAMYGTGYCDAQCPQDIKFINGESNSDGWDSSIGSGKYGSCCMEFDVWEANKISQAYTAHPCTSDEAMRCDSTQGDECGTGDSRYQGNCDRDGCDFATFRNNDVTFYGPGSDFQVDTTRPFTVVTQFHSSDGQVVDDIKRIYVQDGQEIKTPSTSAVEGKSYDSLNDDFCSDIKQVFGDNDQFTAKGGLAQMSKAFQDGMVLVLSIWDDGAAYMNWLDSTFPVGSTKPGAARGTCDPEAGNPQTVESQYPDASVTFSNIRFGAIDQYKSQIELFTQ